MRLLLDEQISGRVAERLRERGRDAVAVIADPMLRGADDRSVFAAAQAQERAVVTYNRADFLAIAAGFAERGEEHHGLVIVHPLRIPNRDIARLTDALEHLDATFAPWPSFVTWLSERP